MTKRVERDEVQIERVEGLLAAAPVSRKAMFGSIAWFLESNGAMFTTVTGEGVGVRLGEERTAELVDSGEARSFPPGSKWPMREYVFFDGDRVTEDDILLALLEEASDYAGTLPPARKKTRKKS